VQQAARNFAIATWLALSLTLAACAQASSSSRVQKTWEATVANFREVLADDYGNSYILSGGHVTNLRALDPAGQELWRWDDLDSPPQYIDETLTDQGLLLTNGSTEAALVDFRGKLQWRSSLRPWELDNYPPDGRTAWYVLPGGRGIGGLGRKGDFLWFTRQARYSQDAAPGEAGVLARDPGNLKQGMLVDAQGKVAVKLPGDSIFARFIDAPRNRSLISGDSLLHLSPRCEVQWEHKLADPDDYRTGSARDDSALVLSSGTFIEETQDGELRAIDTNHKTIWTKQFDHPVHNLLTVRNQVIADWMAPASPAGGPAVAGELQMACIDAQGQELWREGTGLRFTGLPMLQYCGSQIYLLQAEANAHDQQVTFEVACLEVRP
jgi:hypothetical protein